jgi:CRP/FNR family transcriptional regulator, anaerobic regulatory protein
MYGEALPHGPHHQDSAGGAPLEMLCAAIPGAKHTLAPDQHVTLEGSERRSVIGVLSGLLRSFRMTPDGRRHIARFVDPGGLIGLGKIGAFRTSTEAVAVSTIVVFSASAVEAALRTNERVRDAVIASMTGELLARDRIQFRLGRLWADERVADFLLERAGHREEDVARNITLQMSRADIADYLGVTIETISRALSRFQREGLLAMPDAHHFSIVRAAALAALASGDRDYSDPHAMARGAMLGARGGEFA